MMRHTLRSTKWAALCWVASTVWGVALAGPGQFRFEAQPGPYAVGLEVVEQYDHSRIYRHSTDELGKPYRGERARPLQTLLWYPAERSAGRPMTVEDYVGLWDTETSFGEPRRSYKAKQWRSGMASTLAQSLRAVRDAPLAQGHFPVVLYAPGLSESAWDNADLCEYLASFGYVVIASPSLGASGRNMTTDLAGANAQASDISYLIGYARTRQNIDSSRIGVMGGSWGGMSALFAAARDSSISAFIALDGSMRYYPGLVKQAADAGVHPERMSIPLLFFMQGDYSLEHLDDIDPNLRDGPSVLNTWTHGDLIVAHMLGMSHAALASSMWQRNEDYWSQWGRTWVQPGDYDREDKVRGYAWVARYALKFLDAYLKRDTAAMQFLEAQPGTNGVPKHFMTVEYRRAAPAALSLEDFRARIGSEGFDQLEEIYTTFRQQEPGFRLDESAMTDWADELLNDNHLSEAIALLTLNVQAHPDSGAAYGSLAEAYGMSGQRQPAIANFREALARDPGNAVARKKLEDLLTNSVPMSRSNVAP